MGGKLYQFYRLQSFNSLCLTTTKCSKTSRKGLGGFFLSLFTITKEKVEYDFVDPDSVALVGERRNPSV